MDEKRRKQLEYHAALDRQVRDKAMNDQGRRLQSKPSTNLPPLANQGTYKSPDRVLPVPIRSGKENAMRRDERNAPSDDDLALLVGAARGDNFPRSMTGAINIDGVSGPEGYAGVDVVALVQQLAGEVSRQAAASARLHQRHTDESRTLRDQLHRCEAQVVEAQAGRKAAELKARLAADSAALPQASNAAAAAAAGANSHATADAVAKLQHDVRHLQLELKRERQTREEAATATAAERASLAAANRQADERCAGLEDLLRREHAERLASEDRLRANVHDSRQACAPVERVASLELALQRESQARAATIADTTRGLAAAQAQAAQDLRSARTEAESQARAAASAAADSTRALRLDLVSQLEGLERRTTQASADSQARLEAQVGEALRLVHRQATAAEAAAQQRANELRRVLSAEIQARQGGAESSETRAAAVQATLHAQGERLTALEAELAEVAAAKASKKTTKSSKWVGSSSKHSSSSNGSSTSVAVTATTGATQKETNSFFGFGKSKPAKAAAPEQQEASSSSTAGETITPASAAAPPAHTQAVNAPLPPAPEEYHPAQEEDEVDDNDLAEYKRFHAEREAQWQGQMASQVSTAIAEAMRMEANVALPKAPLSLCDDVVQLGARLERLERIALSTASAGSGATATSTTTPVAANAASSSQLGAEATQSNSKPATPEVGGLSAKEAKAREKAEKERVAKEKKDAAAKEKADKAQAAKEAKEARRKGSTSKKRNGTEAADSAETASSAALRRPESAEEQSPASASDESKSNRIAESTPAPSAGDSTAAHGSEAADTAAQQAAAAAAAQAQEQHAADLAALRQEVSRVANEAASAAAEAAAQAQARNDALQERMAGDESRLAELEGDFNRCHAEMEANHHSQSAEKEARRQREQWEAAAQQQRQQQQQARWQSELEQLMRRADESLARADAATQEARQLADSSRAEARASTASMRAELLDQGSSARSRLDAALASHRAEILAEVRSATSAATQDCRDVSRQHLTAAEGAAAASTREAQRAVEAAKAIGAAGQSWDDALAYTKASLTALVTTEGNALRAVVKAATAAEAAERQRREARALEDSEQRIADALAQMRAELQQRHDENMHISAQQQDEATVGLNAQLTEAAARTEVATCLHSLVDQVADREWAAHMHASAGSVALLGRGVMLGLNRTNELADQLEEYAEEDETQREEDVQFLSERCDAAEASIVAGLDELRAEATAYAAQTSQKLHDVTSAIGEKLAAEARLRRGADQALANALAEGHAALERRHEVGRALDALCAQAAGAVAEADLEEATSAAAAAVARAAKQHEQHALACSARFNALERAATNAAANAAGSGTAVAVAEARDMDKDFHGDSVEQVGCSGEEFPTEAVPSASTSDEPSMHDSAAAPSADSINIDPVNENRGVGAEPESGMNQNSIDPTLEVPEDLAPPVAEEVGAPAQAGAEETKVEEISDEVGDEEEAIEALLVATIDDEAPPSKIPEVTAVVESKLNQPTFEEPGSTTPDAGAADEAEPTASTSPDASTTPPTNLAVKPPSSAPPPAPPAPPAETTYSISLLEPLDMIINPDGLVARVNPGGQGERLGIKSWSTLAAVGDGTPVSTLEDLKSAMKAAKAAGNTTLDLTLNAPVRSKAASAVSQLKAARRFGNMLGGGNKRKIGLNAIAKASDAATPSPSDNTSTDAVSSGNN